jgi:hypothetical protein
MADEPARPPTTPGNPADPNPDLDPGPGRPSPVDVAAVVQEALLLFPGQTFTPTQLQKALATLFFNKDRLAEVLGTLARAGVVEPAGRGRFAFPTATPAAAIVPRAAPATPAVPAIAADTGELSLRQAIVAALCETPGAPVSQAELTRRVNELTGGGFDEEIVRETALQIPPGWLSVNGDVYTSLRCTGA